MPRNINVAVLGVSGADHIKGVSGVGKSLLCNRFVRPSADDFIGEHCSVLSEIDFFGSPVINQDHWLYWGSRSLRSSDNSNVVVRVVEQTEFLSDETFDAFPRPAKTEDYLRRCCCTNLRSHDKLMYIQKEQLGSENEFPQQIIPDGVINVDGFVIVWDVSRDVPSHFNLMTNIIKGVAKTKKPIVLALTKSDEMIEISKSKFAMMISSSKDLKNIFLPPIETSSLKNVNIDFVFQSLVFLCTRAFKSIEKPLSYDEEAKNVEQQNIHIKYAFTLLLSQAVPLYEWPHRYSNWQHALADIDRHPDLLNFVAVFGSHVAYEMYERYVTEAENFNTLNRLRTFVPSLLQVFEKYEETIGIVDMDWEAAKELIMSHNFFRVMFYTLEQGSVHSRSQVSEDLNEYKLPAEVLLLPEAGHAFEEFKMTRQRFQYLMKLTEELEKFLEQQDQIHLDTTIEEVLPHIQVFCSIKNITAGSAVELYQQYRERLIGRTKNEILECTMEVLPSLANFRVEISAIDHELMDRCMTGSSLFRSETELAEITDQVIKDCLVFLNAPSHKTCPLNENCLDLTASQSSYAQDELKKNSTIFEHTVHIAGFCGDHLGIYELAKIIQTTLGNLQNRDILPSNSRCIPTSIFKSCITPLVIEIRSYHSMWMSEVTLDSGFYVLAYDGSRRSSFEHSQAAIEKFCMINAKNHQTVVLLALVCKDDVCGELITEGAELCESIGAKFALFNVKASYLMEERVMDLLNLVCGTEATAENARPSVLIPDFSHSETLTVSGNQHHLEKSEKISHNEKGLDNDEKNVRVNFVVPAVMSKFNYHAFETEPAPLATPEATDFSPVYSTVNDLLKPTLIVSNNDSGVTIKCKHSTTSCSNLVVTPAALNDENTSRVSRRTSCISLSTDSIHQLHRTSNLYSRPLSSTDGKSYSSESVTDRESSKEEKTPNRFVRKVASSFRLQKNFLGLVADEKKEAPKTKHSLDNSLITVEKKGSRSLPQSPRSNRKAKIYSSINSTTGKVSNVLSWLPIKSSKILFKNKSATYDLSTSISSFTATIQKTHGVILPNQGLRELSESSKTGIPVYVEMCIGFIEQNGGYEQEGLYRIPGNQSHLTELESTYIASGKFEAWNFDSPVHVAATALKNFFLCLPEALIDEEFHPNFKRIIKIEKVEEKFNAVTTVMEKMPAENRVLLIYLILHFGRVARSSKTAMNSHNLSKVWTPTLFRPAFTSYEDLSSGILAFQLNLEFLISYSEALFGSKFDAE